MEVMWGVLTKVPDQFVEPKGSIQHQNLDADNVLLQRVAGGDMEAMREIYMSHSEPVQRFARRIIHDDSAVADIVQETMLIVWRKAAKFERRSSVRSWILAIARNKAIDLIRKDARTTLSEPDKDIPDDAPDPEAVIAATQESERVRHCIAELSDRHRLVVHLAFFEELSYPDIAQIEGIAEGTVKTRIFHAKKLLMRCLSRNWK